MPAKKSTPACEKKKRKSNSEHLVELHRGHHVSKSALVHILDSIKENGLPSAYSRRTQARAYDDIANVETTYGKVIQEISIPSAGGREITVGMQMPVPMLCACIQKCAGFREFFRSIYQDRPSSMAKKWRLIVYFDGITPTDGLSKKSR